MDVVAMKKVEAVVLRERVEIVIDAVEEQTGHVGVTVVEAVGHGRQRGITHEYRGRVFESRFLPKALLAFVVADELAAAAAGTTAATASSGRPRSTTSLTTAPAYRCGARRRKRREELRPAARRQHPLGRGRGRARDVHAGRLRLPRGGPDADEERRAHRRQERPHP